MNRLLLLLPLLAACGPATPTVNGWDPGVSAADCLVNSPPFIGNIEMDSAFVNEAWYVSIHFDWADPGRQGATDPPNLLFGYFSAEARGFDFPSAWLRPQELEAACILGPDDLEAGATCAGFGSNDEGFPHHTFDGCADAANCQQGELTAVVLPENGVEYMPFDVTFRIRDRCGIQSNEVTIPYVLGDGLQVLVDDAAAGDDDTGGS
jgi:hypothetical protein